MRPAVIAGVSAAAVVVVVLTVLGLALLGGGRLAYIEKATGLELPNDVYDVDIFDNGEFFLVAHLRLREEDAASLARSWGMAETPLEVESWTGVLQPGNREIPAGADMLYLEGGKAGNRWLAALDGSSGRLWIVVLYPDYGGDAP